MILQKGIFLLLRLHYTQNINRKLEQQKRLRFIKKPRIAAKKHRPAAPHFLMMDVVQKISRDRDDSE
jgi:hypothetical protein